MSSKRVEKPLFQRLRFSFLLSRSHRLSRSPSLSFPGDWKQIILLELPPSSWSVIGLVPRQHTDATRFCLRSSRSTVIVDPFFFISISGKPQLSRFFSLSFEKECLQIENQAFARRIKFKISLIKWILKNFELLTCDNGEDDRNVR